MMFAPFRLIGTQINAARAAPLGPFETDIVEMRCWPSDIDMFFEMNNGRVLTLYDLGRYSLSRRTGLIRALSDNKWGVAVAGSSVRYRKRILPFQRFELRTRLLGWDARFIYLEQSMWRGSTACNHALMRTAVVDKSGAVSTQDVIAAMGLDGMTAPSLPLWVKAWIEADGRRPWPPEV